MMKLLCCVLSLAAAPAFAQERAPDPVMQVPGFALPPSNQLSDEAKAVLQRMKAETAPDLNNDVARQREFYGAWNDRRLGEMHRRFATTEHRTTMNGVTVDVVTPRAGVPARNFSAMAPTAAPRSPEKTALDPPGCIEATCIGVTSARDILAEVERSTVRTSIFKARRRSRM